MTKAKPFDIPKREVWEAFKKVKANQGAAGVDGQSIADFEAQLAEQPLQALESAVVGQLHAATGAPGGHPERRVAERGRWASHGRGSDRARGCPPIPGARVGTAVPRGLLWLSAGAFGDRCGPDGASAMLALRLGPRPRHQGLLR